jgi:endonuclease-3
MLNTKQRYKLVIDYFLENQPIAETELVYKTAYQLMVAVVLSAQCTDKRVNIITPAFFNRFPDFKKLSEGKLPEIFELIKSCSYPNNKSKNLLEASKFVINNYGGELPSSLDELIKIPGIGRKSANVLLSIVFNKPAMAVDTHVFRVSERIGLTTNSKNPYETEMQLIKNIPEEKLGIAHHWLILHGRYICKAKKPLCIECGISEFCKFFTKLKLKKNDK